MNNTDLTSLKSSICKLKTVEFFIYVAIAIVLCLAIIFKWTFARYVTYLVLSLTIFSDVVIENLLYKDFIFFSGEKEDEE